LATYWPPTAARAASVLKSCALQLAVFALADKTLVRFAQPQIKLPKQALLIWSISWKQKVPISWQLCELLLHGLQSSSKAVPGCNVHCSFAVADGV
jgi:hypothetical protein